MHTIEHIISLLRQFGAPGLFGLALIDSAGVPTGGAPDWMLVLLLSEHSALSDLIATVPLAVLGSAMGSMVPYYLGRRGGELVLRRFAADRSRVMGSRIHRYGFWFMVFSVMVPPPYPMKLVMVSAGVFRMSAKTFLGAVVLGRCIRYSVVGYLALRYGEKAIEVFGQHLPLAIGGIVGVIACLFVLNTFGIGYADLSLPSRAFILGSTHKEQ